MGTDETLLLEQLKEIMIQELGTDEASVTMDAHIIPDLNADSFDLVQLVMVTEDALGITIPDEDMDCTWTVKEFYAYIRDRLHNRDEMR